MINILTSRVGKEEEEKVSERKNDGERDGEREGKGTNEKRIQVYSKRCSFYERFE